MEQTPEEIGNDDDYRKKQPGINITDWVVRSFKTGDEIQHNEHDGEIDQEIEKFFFHVNLIT